ncbi:hypothetical protein CEP48_03445 [Mergibacter septicus]|uniref:Uncharacterized protein n=1 Tax=Mergibacter septicus TaxID=221402 RepID=A0A8D4LN65_9PAST|nr:secA translation cis-regulator SecM [Mergibacter septicus]AWX15273.1 hypothetical protein CEP47_03445 [Mergibacter septicus]QDJ14527.1 hypothetical protein CEP48_03445 [Mergibacter septicus]UTU48036.1 DUF2547 family protein [Mergibacter septicus]WMR96355.1 secA translation cis-regulator SecM [Mergibacter septicus]
MQQVGLGKQQFWSQLLLGMLAIFVFPLHTEHKLTETTEVNYTFTYEKRSHRYNLLAENLIISTQRLIKQQNAKYRTSNLSSLNTQYFQIPIKIYTKFIKRQYSIRAGPFF